MIDPSKPVFLKKQVIGPDGNRYLVRKDAYQPGELPARYLTDEYCAQDVEVSFEAQKEAFIADRTLYQAKGITQPTVIRAVPTKTAFTPVDTPEEEQAVPDSVVEEQPQPEQSVVLLDESNTPITEEPVVIEETTPSTDKLNVNTATAAELEALPKVGKATVARLIKIRELGEFESIEDLEKRVPLPFGKSWTSLADAIEV